MSSGISEILLNTYHTVNERLALATGLFLLYSGFKILGGGIVRD